MGFCVYPIWCLQIFSDVCINICDKIWVVLAMTYTLFLLFFPCFCSNTSIINILVCLMVSPQVSETVTFIFLQFKRIPSTDIFKCSDYFPSSNITEPSTNIFKYCTFQLQNSYLILVGLRPKLKDVYMRKVTITGLPSYL